MIGPAGQWTRTPSATSLQLKNEMLIFGLHSTSDNQPGWSMDSNPICHPSPAKKMKCSFLDYVQLLMISWAGRWTQTPSATSLQPKKIKCSFLDYIQLLMIGWAGWWTQTPSTTPLQQKNEMLIFGLCSTSDDQPGWSMDSNPIHYPSPAKKMKCSFLDYIQLLMIGWAGWWTRTPSATSLQQKKWNAHFWITFNFWWLARLVDGLEPHLPSSPAIKMKCSFLDYVQLLMIGYTRWWTQIPSTTPLQPKIWNAHFWIMFNFWWLATLVDGLKSHPPPLSSQKYEMLIFGLCSTSDDWPSWSMDSNPICHLSPAKKWNAHFWITFNFWWLAQLVNGLKPHLPLLSSQKNEMLIFGLHSTSDDQLGWLMDSNPICYLSPAKKNKMLIFGLHSTSDDRLGWLMDSNPIHHPSPAKKMKCSFLDYVQLLMISLAGQWTQTPSTTPLQPKKWNAHFWITFNFWWLAGLVNGLEPDPLPLSSKKNEMLIFGLCSTSDDWLHSVMDSNPIHHPSPAKNMKCSFLDYVQLLMIGYTGWWTQIPSTTPLQPKIWNAHFWIMFNFWWLARPVNGLEPHMPSISSQKMKCSFLDYVQLLMIGQAGQWTWTPSATSLQENKMKCSFLDYVQLLMISLAGQWTRTPSTTPLQPKKWNAHFWITFNFWWLAGLVDGLEPHLPPLSSKKNEMLIFRLCSTSDDWPSWSLDSNHICHPLQPKIWNAHFWIMFNFWWLATLVDGLKSHPPPLSSQKYEMLIFGLCSTSDDWPGQSMDSNPICHPSPAKKMKCSFLDYVQLLMIGQAGQWTWTPSATSLQENKMKCSFLDYVQLLMICWAGRWTQTPSATPLQPIKWNAHFWITFNFWWSAKWSEWWTVTEMQKMAP